MQVIIPLLVTVFLTAAQTNPAPASAAEADKTGIHLEGTVLNSITGEPVPRADVRLQRNANANGPGPSSYNQTGDANGKFVFDNVAAGIYGLIAEKSGFIIGGPGNLLSINKGQSFEKLDIKLLPQGVIVGRVIDENGEPLAMGSQVFWFQYGYVQGKKQLIRRLEGSFAASDSQTLTNDLGEYRFANLRPGKYFVVAIAPLPNVRSGDLSGTSGPQERNVDTYYPSATDPAVAVPVEVTAGAESRGIDIHVKRAAVYSIRGKVVGGAGSTKLMSLTRTDGIPGTPGVTQVRPDGSFEFPYVSPGSYVLNPRASIPSGPLPFSGSLDIKVTNRNLDDLMLQLVPTASGEINGTVRVEGGDLQAILKPQPTPSLPPGASTTARSGIYVAFREPGENCPSGGRIWPVSVDGTFQIQQIAPSKYSWCVTNLPSGTYIKSARFNDQDVTREFIDTTNSGGGTIEIVVSRKSADLAGSVADDKGVLKAGVRVTLWMKTADPSNSNGGVYQTTTDQNGSFRLSGLAPGNYYAAAWEEILPPGLEMYPEFLSRFNGDTTAVTLEEGGHASRNAKFISAERIDAEIAKLP
jgi:protocatechuate 3,4-dioxygenase beta subunit